MTKKSKRWLLASAVVIVLISGALVLNTRYVVDYGSGAKGIVVDSSGHPVAGAQINMYFDRTVFEAITPVREAQLTSGVDGRFRQSFISCGRPGGRYRISVKKDGYDLAVVTGTGMGAHRIILRAKSESRHSPSSTSLQPWRLHPGTWDWDYILCLPGTGSGINC